MDSNTNRNDSSNYTTTQGVTKMTIDVAKLKNILRLALEQLDKLGDNYPIEVVSNTYFLGHPKYFLSMASEGYINLDEIIEGDLGADIDIDESSTLNKFVYLNDEMLDSHIIFDDLLDIVLEDGFSQAQLDAMDDTKTVDELHYYLLDNLSDFMRERH